ncbi:hypothetical protein LQZ24_02365 [Fructobacillus sp. M1-13]|uniref:Lipoprotein n=1 Tax=Fructobacillus papyriferae TaxID=2713171 RepID=A0ABS5QP08_9LACO|nr:hypothetical protein [Fructobacillus papyriferae]MBS9334883.1 hypothetical protein [Fructobacillus papyriferae]MCD2158873.1 hypothetical protein [Fructobacillus papyriferae]
MIKQNKLLVTIVLTIVVGTGAVVLTTKKLNSSANLELVKKSASQSSSSKDGSWKKNAVSEGTIVDDSDQNTNADTKEGANNHSSANGSSSSSSSSSNSTSNTLTEDDFRSSDNLAYRMLTLYGMVNGDSSWKALQSASGITMTRQSDSTPTFVATATNGGSTKAYYRYVMNSNDTESQKKPLSFSKDDDGQYRATVSDVLSFVNANGGRSTVEKLNFKLIE